MDKKSLKKKLEQFRKTQSINKIVQKGSIEDQALMDSAGEDRPAEEMHALDLITQEEGAASGVLPAGRIVKNVKRSSKINKISHIIKKLKSSSKKAHRKR